MRKFLSRSLKRIILPLRRLLARLMLNEEDTIFWKAAIFISRNEIKGDYLEFGVFKGHSS